MKDSKVLKWILIVIGINLTIMGLWRFVDPIGFFEFSGLILSEDAGLLNEARGTGGAIIGFGLLILLGAFKKKLAFTSTIVAIILFFGFGIARVISVFIDGNPGEALYKGIIGEFVMGSIALFALIKYRDKSQGEIDNSNKIMEDK